MSTLLWLIPTVTFLLGVVVGVGGTAYYVRHKMNKMLSNPASMMSDMFEEGMLEE